MDTFCRPEDISLVPTMASRDLHSRCNTSSGNTWPVQNRNARQFPSHLLSLTTTRICNLDFYSIPNSSDLLLILNKMAHPTSSSSSSTTIDDLPKLTLLTFFDQLPLTELVHIEEVSRQWRELKSAALLRRTELIISTDVWYLKWFEVSVYSFIFHKVKKDDGSPFVKRRDRLDRHSLCANQMKPEMVDSIIRLMPKLTVIGIQQEGTVTELWKIKHLVHHYRHQLTKVTISFAGTSDGLQAHLESTRNGFRDMFTSLITTLNSMTALTSLGLFLYMPEGMKTSIEVNLSVASRLKELNVYTQGFTDRFNDVDLLQHTYQTYAEESSRLQVLCSPNSFRLDTLLSFGPRVSAALQEVHMRDWLGPDQTDALRQIACKFSNMKALSLNASRLSVAQLTQELTSCQALVYLSIALNFDNALANGLPVDQLPVLSTVKVLALKITTVSHHRDWESMNLEVIFPNVQLILLQQKLNQCQTCNFTVPRDFAQGPKSMQTAYSFLIHECQRLFRVEFAKFNKLTSLEADIGLEQITSSYKRKVTFTRDTLGKVTYDVQGTLANLE